MRPFGRTFWLCLAGVAILAVIGIIILFRAPADLRPRFPGQASDGASAPVVASAPPVVSPPPAAPAAAPPAPAPAAAPPSPAAATPLPPSQVMKAVCSDRSVADLTSEASRQLTNGEPAAALRLLRVAIACKADVALYRLAVTCACAAHDQAAAELYIPKLPDAEQAAARQRCQPAHDDRTQ